jgi:hypothetical protein
VFEWMFAARLVCVEKWVVNPLRTSERNSTRIVSVWPRGIPKLATPE